jgi:hypothetical protein
MPACLKRASSVFLDSPVKPGNDGVGDGDVVIIVRPLINQKREKYPSLLFVNNPEKGKPQMESMRYAISFGCITEKILIKGNLRRIEKILWGKT